MTARVRYGALPWLAGVEALVADGVLTGASGRNWAAYGHDVRLGDGLPAVAQALLTDPQTSGGLLVACAPEAVDDVLACFRDDGFERAAAIGEMVDGAARVDVS